MRELQSLTKSTYRKEQKRNHPTNSKISEKTLKPSQQDQTSKLPKSKPTNLSQMSLRINLFTSKPLQLIPNFQTNTYLSCPSRTHLNIASSRLQISISCTSNNNSFSDAELALKLTTEVEKLNFQIVQREEALKKSRQLLFDELSSYMGLKADEVKKKWRKMNEDDKWAVVKGFVSEWSDRFHPLSARSVKELVDEFLADVEKQSFSGSGTMLFPSLRKLIGFSENNSSNEG